MDPITTALDLTGTFTAIGDQLTGYAPQILAAAGVAVGIGLGFWALKYGVRLFKSMAK